MYVRNDAEMKQYNSYRIPATFEKALFPENKDDIFAINHDGSLKTAILIGAGNNIIFSKSYYKNNPVIVMADNFANVSVYGNEIYTLSGTSLKQLSYIAYEYGLTGLEIFYDIPGTIGGAIYMNAGAYGEEISSLIKEVEVVDRVTGKTYVLQNKELSFDYRRSTFQNNKDLMIISASLILQVRNKASILKKMLKYYVKRRSHFPYEYPNAGSVFKRPKIGLPVGKMVEELGLKGYQIGGAMISRKHAGFIVNYDNATATDIVSLANFIQREIEHHYQVSLEMEQVII